MNIIGYTYEADYHCEGCTHKRFVGSIDTATDSEGNAVHPVFSWDEGVGEAYCGDCLGELV